MNIPDPENDFSLADAIDQAILMHRDAHFGGNFKIMLEYYEGEGKGVNPEFELSRIQELAYLEEKTQQNLASVLLSGPDAERVQKAKESYKKLQSLYEIYKGKKRETNKHPLLIADLILSEDAEPQNEIDAIVAEKGAIVPALIKLLKSEEFYDPLFPGYGHAPVLASKCLGLIGDKRAIIALFEGIGESDFFNEDDILEALKRIGEPAKEFLLKVLHGRPLNFDNERAAIALVYFRNDPEVSKACLEMLSDPKVQADPVLSTYLILCCEGLQEAKDRKDFANLKDIPKLQKNLKQDIDSVIKTWN